MLLANRFENEATFLVHMMVEWGVTPPELEWLRVSVLYERWVFSVDFVHLFLRLSDPSPLSLLRLNRTLLFHFEHCPHSVEFLIYLIPHFNFNYTEKSRLISILKLKLAHSSSLAPTDIIVEGEHHYQAHPFLLFVRNPVKVLMLLNELITKSPLSLTDSSSCLSH